MALEDLLQLYSFTCRCYTLVIKQLASQVSLNPFSLFLQHYFRHILYNKFSSNFKIYQVPRQSSQSARASAAAGGKIKMLFAAQIVDGFCHWAVPRLFLNSHLDPLQTLQVLLYVREYQADLSLQGRPQRNTTVHLQRLGPSFILVAALTVLHTLMGTTAGKQNGCQQNSPGSDSHCVVAAGG